MKFTKLSINKVHTHYVRVRTRLVALMLLSYRQMTSYGFDLIAIAAIVSTWRQHHSGRWIVTRRNDVFLNRFMAYVAASNQPVPYRLNAHVHVHVHVHDRHKLTSSTCRVFLELHYDVNATNEKRWLNVWIITVHAWVFHIAQSLSPLAIWRHTDCDVVVRVCMTIWQSL